MAEAARLTPILAVSNQDNGLPEPFAGNGATEAEQGAAGTEGGPEGHAEDEEACLRARGKDPAREP